MKEITLEEARETIELFPNEDDFVHRNVQMSFYGEYSDNSIELAYYYRQCKNILLLNGFN